MEEGNIKNSASAKNATEGRLWA